MSESDEQFNDSKKVKSSSKKWYIIGAIIAVVIGYIFLGVVAPKYSVETYHYKFNLRDASFSYDEEFGYFASKFFDLNNVNNMGWKLTVLITNNYGSDSVLVGLYRGEELLWDSIDYMTHYRLEKTFHYTGDLAVAILCKNGDLNIEIIIEEWKSALPFF
jgi:hypothetical protein